MKEIIMKKSIVYFLAFALSLVLLCSCVNGGETQNPVLDDGTFQGTAKSKNGDLTVEMVIENGVISSLQVLSHIDDVEYAQKAINELPPIIVENQSLGVDVISGATLTSRGILAATANAIREAGPHPRDFGYVATGEVANAQQLTIVGGTNGDIVLSGEEVKGFEALDISTVSVNSSGTEKTVEAKGTLLQDILEANGLSQLDYGSIILTASDGYSIEVPSEVLETRDIIIAYEINGEEVDLRTVVPDERAMYWVKFISKIELLDPKQAEETKRIAIIETHINLSIDPEDYNYNGSIDKAVPLNDAVLLGSSNEDEFVMIVGLDGWSKTERWELAAAQYLKITGEHAPMFIGPDLPEGMRMKQTLMFKYGDECLLSGEMATLKLEEEQKPLTLLSLLELAEMSYTEDDVISVMYGNGVFHVVIPADELSKAEIKFEDGKLLMNYYDEDSMYNKDISEQILSIYVGELMG